MSDMRTELDRALRREATGCYICQPDNPAAAEEGCESCERHYFQHVVRCHEIAELAAANHAAMTAHKAAKSYSDATAAAWYVTQSALAAALIEHQGGAA